MAYNNQEIELKLSISRSEYKRIEKELYKVAKFLRFSHQVDDYFTPTQNSFLDEKYPFQWLSTRKRDQKIYLNYKHWHPEGRKYTTHCDEYEVEVSDENQIKNILIALKFQKITTVEKKRSVFLYQKSLEIALDQVKDLGFFVEVESVKNFGSVRKANKEILKFTKSLGLRGTKPVPGGYAAESLRKKRLLK
ncbi:hypothetical protein A3A75_04960 [Candidatus Woesebacteria bacterium RIFCSPLOWO2_01_FULL_39_10]|uniref:CYTH domain-containing protein n=1 Tax=Candidatus Woesebacteria bacterium RIFCSPLOWO2_01_FULL_39_10 TaxID=1802516 RepID=A0A1F8B347_9BACT|nr:MAG: hypothetical protein A3A75_04960 [Candidatus Woesebacteria bacterium RIFCSPLOWO2_01_FULL_39_10]